MRNIVCGGKFSDEDEAYIALFTEKHEKHEKFETINLLRSKIVTTLESKIDALFLVRADGLSIAIDAITSLIRRHATLSYMTTHKTLEGFPDDYLIKHTARLVGQSAPHASLELTNKITHFITQSPYSQPVRQAHIKNYRELIRVTKNLEDIQLQLKVAATLGFTIEELLPPKPVTATPQGVDRVSPLAKHTLLHAYAAQFGGMVNVNDKFTDKEQKALQEIKNGWHYKD